jgi:hypothetical protein
LIKKFKGQELYGHITLVKCERSAVSAIAAVTVAAWKSAKKYFGEVKDFVSKCLFDASKEAKVWVSEKA